MAKIEVMAGTSRTADQVRSSALWLNHVLRVVAAHTQLATGDWRLGAVLYGGRGYLQAGASGAQNRVRPASTLAKSDREESTSGVVSSCQRLADIGLHPQQSPHGAPGQVRGGFS